MYRTWILVGIVSASMLVAVGGCMSAEETEGVERAALEMDRPGQVICRSIDFDGNTKFKASALKKKVGFKVGETIEPAWAEIGRAELEQYYRSKGYANVVVVLDPDRIAVDPNRAAADPNESIVDRGAVLVDSATGGSYRLDYGHLTYRITEGGRLTVKSVKFKGNKHLKSGQLKNVVKCNKRRWGVLPGFYVQDTVDADVERLSRVYRDRGFLNHQIMVTGDSQIVFEISEGVVFDVNSVTFTGGDYLGAWKLNEDLELPVGKSYLDKKARSHIKRLTTLYMENGFIDSFIEHKTQFVLDAEGRDLVIRDGRGLVDVEFRIEQGDQFKIGEVTITGNAETQDRVFRRIMDEYEFTPGEPYNADLAPATGGGYLEKRLRRMTLVEQAHIRPLDSNMPADSNGVKYADVQVNVEEGLTGLVMPGVGVSSDSGFIGRLIYQQRNFDISDWPESLKDLFTMQSFKGAGQTLRIALEPGTEVSQYSINFTEPYLNDKPTSLDVSGSSFDRFRESWDEGRIRGGFTLEKRLKNKWRPSIGFRGESVDIGDFDTDAPQELRDVKGGNLLLGLKVGLSRHLVDDEWNPGKGSVYGINYEQVTGDYDFGLLSANYGVYHTVSTDLADRKTILATKVLGATVVGDAPPFEKFYGGGTGFYGIRGFEYRGVSPRGLQTNVANPERKDPVGSDWIFVASSELSIPIVGESLAWLIFVDGGVIDEGPIRASVGTGIQIMIPQWFGPVPMRFSLALPISKDSDDDAEIFSFSAGGLF